MRLWEQTSAWVGPTPFWSRLTTGPEVLEQLPRAHMEVKNPQTTPVFLVSVAISTQIKK